MKKLTTIAIIALTASFGRTAEPQQVELSVLFHGKNDLIFQVEEAPEDDNYYWLQRSPDLESWNTTALLIHPSSTGTARFRVDPEEPQGFYRVVGTERLEEKP